MPSWAMQKPLAERAAALERPLDPAATLGQKEPELLVYRLEKVVRDLARILPKLEENPLGTLADAEIKIIGRHTVETAETPPHEGPRRRR